MATKFSKDAGKTIETWLNKVQNVKFHYYYKPKNNKEKSKNE